VQVAAAVTTQACVERSDQSLIAAPAGDTRKLLEDCAVLKPTIFCAVPRVFERVYSGVMDKVRHVSQLQQLNPWPCKLTASLGLLVRLVYRPNGAAARGSPGHLG
jgi:hypothetical protein